VRRGEEKRRRVSLTCEREGRGREERREQEAGTF